MDVDGLWEELARSVESALHGYRQRVHSLNVREKADRTLLTDADLAVEQIVTSAIRTLDPSAVIVAEEDDRTEPRADVLAAPEHVWVVDPIDGTAEFVKPTSVEFCTVVCLLRRWQPVAAFVLAPELGRDRRPLVITADSIRGVVSVNGRAAEPPVPGRSRLASVTRSRRAPPPPFEDAMRQAGFTLKTRTTSQTIDMVRTAVDLRPFTDQGMTPFSLFYRSQQKVWDGLAGLCLEVLTE
ncbi:MAG: inositol monophosphatase family protein [Micromonosporaceae bacterium]